MVVLTINLASSSPSSPSPPPARRARPPRPTMPGPRPRPRPAPRRKYLIICTLSYNPPYRPLYKQEHRGVIRQRKDLSDGGALIGSRIRIRNRIRIRGPGGGGDVAVPAADAVVLVFRGRRRGLALRHCPGRKAPERAVKRPARLYKSPIQNVFS